MSLRLVGMLIAGLLLGTVLAVIGIAVITAPPKVIPGQATPGGNTPPFAQGQGVQTPDLPDIPDPGESTQAPTDINSIAGDPGAPIQSVAAWRYRFTNAKGERQAVVTAANFDPIQRGVYELIDVEATIFREDRVVRLIADKGEIRGQRGEQPESGLLSGDVSVSLYPPGVTEDEAKAHESGEGGVPPELRFTTNAIRFDTTLGQGVAPGQIGITAPGLRLDGRGLTLRFGTDTTSDDPRLLLVRLDESDGLQLWPDRLPTNDKRRSGSRDRDGAHQPAAAPDAEPAMPTVYRFSMTDSVTIARESYAARADTLQAYARLFDGELRAGAIKSLNLRRDQATDNPATGATTAPGDSPTQSDPPILVTWNGPFELIPLLNPPGVLDFDDVVVRFSSDDEGNVRMGDELAGVGLEARTVTYFASSAFFEARAETPGGVALKAQRVADLVCTSLDVDLSQSPALRTFISTPGDATDVQGRSVRWSQRAQFDADLSSDRLLAKQLTLVGDVTLDSGDHEGATATNLAIAFDGEGRPRTISAEGDVRAHQVERGRTMEGDRALLTLEPLDGNAFALTQATVSGNARAVEGERTFEGDNMTATFTDGEVVGVNATDGVNVTLENGLAVACDTLRSDRVRESIDLVGTDDEPVTVTRETDGITLTMTVGSARVEEPRQRITGFGPGTGTLVAADASAQYESAELIWGGGFVFDGKDQKLELLGGIGIEAKKDENETHRASAERAEIDLTGVDSGDARVIGARLYAGPGLDGVEIPATAEARRTMPDPENDRGRSLESLLEVRSSELLVDVESQRVDAPGAGRLVVEDRRPDETREPTDAQHATLSGRGTSVFNWSGSMQLALSEGRATLDRDVRVRYLPSETTELTQLDCQRLDAFFEKSASSSEEGGFTIQRLDARESVYANHRGLELIADTLVYRASTEQIVASASAGNRVTVFDPARSGHYNASSVLIDLVTGNWTSENATGAGGAP